MVYPQWLAGCRMEADNIRVRYWGRVGVRWLCAVVLEDGETLHNAFYDRRFKP